MTIMDIIERIKQLRKGMEEEHIDAYLIPTGDYHNSEYVCEYFKVREYYSGFTGSNGLLLILQDKAGLWTDGRYFIQAENELKGSEITLFRMGEEGVPTIYQYLSENLKEGMTLAADGKTMPKRMADKLLKLGKESNYFQFDLDLGGRYFEGRKKLPAEKVVIYEQNLFGTAVTDKIESIRKQLKEKKCSGLFLNKLDDIMWLFQIRGNDIPYCPVALSYAFISEQKAVLFLQKNVCDDTIRKYATEQSFSVQYYEDIEDFLDKELSEKDRVWMDDRHVTYGNYNCIHKHCEVLFVPNPTELSKAVKNGTEEKYLRDIYQKDSTAVTKFICWLKKAITTEHITEMDAARRLQAFRKEIPEYFEDSFETISAYRANAAMMHYEPSDDHEVHLGQKGMLLVDSGGQYRGGTTDVTRTIVLGPLTSEEKKHYTWTAIGMLKLTNAHFPYGCTGRNLDILAREKLWEHRIDYKCGTGHGIGYILNVHEGPHAIRWKQNPDEKEPEFEDGMLITNEPGVYIEGSHGIRIENVMICKKDRKTLDGQFMRFDTLTFVPLDPEAIDIDEMSKEDILRYNDYQEKVYEINKAFLKEPERDWLKNVTKPLKTY